MREIERRLKNVEKSLTPKQVVLAWLEAQRFDTPEDYCSALSKRPKDRHQFKFPLLQVKEAHLRNRKIEQLNEGERKELREAMKQTSFLLSLHFIVNEDFVQRSRPLAAQAIILVEQLRAKLERESTHATLLEALRHLPYPLSEVDAACVTFALRNSVITFAELEKENAKLIAANGHAGDRENRDVAEWVKMHLARQGKVSSSTPIQNSACRISDVTDTDFKALIRSVVGALKALTASGEIVAMRQLSLPSVPIAPLRRLAIVEGWVDARAIELAEFGALLLEKRFQLEPSDDPHPLGWPWIFPQCQTGESEDSVMQETVQHLSGFTGGVRFIEGRKFLSLADYAAWSDRRVKGELKIEHGFSVASFNAWLEKNAKARQSWQGSCQITSSTHSLIQALSPIRNAMI